MQILHKIDKDFRLFLTLENINVLKYLYKIKKYDIMKTSKKRGK